MKRHSERPASLLVLALCFYAATGLFSCIVLNLRNPGLLSFLNGSAQEDETVKMQEVIPEEPTPAEPEPEVTEPEEPAAAEPTPEEPQPQPEDTEPAAELGAVETPTYYAYTCSAGGLALHVRKAPDLQADILFKIPTGYTGYVLEKGDSWSRIETDQGDGYASNEYLTFQEVSEEEYRNR